MPRASSLLIPYTHTLSNLQPKDVSGHGCCRISQSVHACRQPEKDNRSCFVSFPCIRRLIAQPIALQLIGIHIGLAFGKNPRRADSEPSKTSTTARIKMTLDVRFVPILLLAKPRFQCPYCVSDGSPLLVAIATTVYSCSSSVSSV